MFSSPTHCSHSLMLFHNYTFFISSIFYKLVPKARCANTFHTYTRIQHQYIIKSAEVSSCMMKPSWHIKHSVEMLFKTRIYRGVEIVKKNRIKEILYMFIYTINRKKVFLYNVSLFLYFSLAIIIFK